MLIDVALYIYWCIRRIYQQAQFDLTFDSAEEDAVRKAIFAKTDAMINQHNADPEATFQMGHNLFSSMVTTTFLFDC